MHIRVLILEDNPADSELMLDELWQAGFEPEWERVETEADYRASLNPALELVLSDYTLPQFNALRALQIMHERGLDIPFVIVSGSIGEELAVAAMKQGAADYLLKDRMARLGLAVRHVLEANKLRIAQRQAEETLRRSEQKFRHLFANNPLPMWVYDRHTLAFLDVNEAAVSHYGYSREEFLDMRILDIRPAEEVPHLLENLAQPRPALERSEGPWRHRLKNGQFIDVEISSHTLEFDGHEAALVVANDITDRKRAEEALERERSLLRTVIDNIPDRIFAKDSQGRFLINNLTDLRTLAALAPSQPVGKTVYDFFPPDLAGQYDADDQQVMRTGESLINRENPILEPSGEQRWILTTKVPLRDGQGNVVGLVGITRDITERKQAEAELLRAELLWAEVEQEKELIKLKERFISMVSHDFRSPLAVIQASTDLLGTYFERLSPEKRHRYLEDIHTQVRYMVELLDDVLTIDKARSDKLKPVLAPLNLAAYCSGILEQMRLADKTGHVLVFSSEDEYADVLMDENLLRRILVNLLSNAIKYSPKGQEIRFELSIQDQQICFVIRDQGIGIPAKDQKRLFEAFHRANNTGKIEGTGLGLAVVKSSVDALGGTITFESIEGRGTTFIVCVPIVEFTPEDRES